jgi:CHASE2 domain-containing sensor protein
LIDESTKGVFWLAAVGAAVGLGQLLASSEKLTKRIVFGRAIVSAGIGASSAAALVLWPELPMAAQLGIAAALASLGTSALERLFQRVVGK